MPIIDVTALLRGDPDAVEATAAELRYANEQVGFYFLAGHGISDDLITATYAAAASFHAQPLEAKLALEANADNVGYMPIKGSITKTSKVHVNTKPNLNEAYFLKRESDAAAARYGRPPGNRNQWPQDLPDFRAATLRYMQAMEHMGRQLIPVYARALGLPPTFFDQAFQTPETTLRLSHYPYAKALEDNEFGVAPHTDGNFITFLPANPINGLAVRMKDGTWFDVPYVPNVFVVNTGDTLARWSNDVFVSTPHRVINRSGDKRYAIPFFLNANVDTMVACLQTCQNEASPPKYEAMTVGQYSEWFQRTNYLHLQNSQAA